MNEVELDTKIRDWLTNVIGIPPEEHDEDMIKGTIQAHKDLATFQNKSTKELIPELISAMEFDHEFIMRSWEFAFEWFSNQYNFLPVSTG